METSWEEEVEAGTGACFEDSDSCLDSMHIMVNIAKARKATIFHPIVPLVGYLLKEGLLMTDCCAIGGLKREVGKGGNEGY